MRKRIQSRPYLFEQVTKVKSNCHFLFSLDERALRNYETILIGGH
jgi:hypothetical protein